MVVVTGKNKALHKYRALINIGYRLSPMNLQLICKQSGGSSKPSQANQFLRSPLGCKASPIDCSRS